MKKAIFFISLFFAVFVYGQNYNSCLFAEGMIEQGEYSYDLDRFIRGYNPQEEGILNYFPSYGIHQIGNLNRSELRLIRNTIYAKHGYIFNSIDLQEYFSQFNWYAGTKTNVDNELTINEWRIISFISQIENNYPSYVSNKIIGTWNTGIPDDWWKYSVWELPYVRQNGKELRFWPNGIFFYYDPHNDNATCWGLWSHDGNKFRLTLLFIWIGSNCYIFDPNRHHNSFTTSLEENILFYNNRRNDYGEEVWECNFQRNLPSWKKVSTDPNNQGTGDR
jgi:hypothetical protein